MDASPTKPGALGGTQTTRMSAPDALLWQIERDPRLRTTIVAISMLDRDPDIARLEARVAAVVRQVPRMRQCVDDPRGGVLGVPRWVEADEVDLAFHLRHVALPQPGDGRALLDLAGVIAMGAFDPARPLWEFTLVTGVTGVTGHAGGAALIQKFHHSLSDGVGAVELARLLFDPSADDEGVADATESRRDEPAASRWLAPITAAVKLSTAAPRIVTRVLTDPVGVATSAIAGVQSVAKLIAPVREPRSPLMRGRGLARRLDAFDVDLACLRRAAHVVDASLNDAFLAAVGEGLLRYHRRHDVDLDALRVTMPINLRRDDHDRGSNHFAPARFTMPIRDVDPGTRMRELGALARRWRSEPALPFTDAIAGVLDRAPVEITAALFGGMLRAMDVVATNVPGLTDPVFLAGAEVVRQYAFAPPSGAALSVALLSHGAHCCIGINADVAAVPDGDVLTACLREGFDDVLGLGRQPRRSAKRGGR